MQTKCCYGWQRSIVNSAGKQRGACVCHCVPPPELSGTTREDSEPPIDEQTISTWRPILQGIYYQPRAPAQRVGERAAMPDNQIFKVKNTFVLDLILPLAHQFSELLIPGDV